MEINFTGDSAQPRYTELHTNGIQNPIVFAAAFSQQKFRVNALCVGVRLRVSVGNTGQKSGKLIFIVNDNGNCRLL